MLEKSYQKLLVVLGILALLVAFGYYVFSSTEVQVTSESLIEQDAVGQDIIILAEKLNNINIDDSIFTSAVFLSLIDRDIPISVESQGRVNPFASIGNDGGSSNNIKSTLKPPTLPR